MSGHRPPKDVAAAAERAVSWIQDGKAGSGFTETGEHRARQLASREDVDDQQIGKMKQYFARHRGDSDTEGFHRGEDGYPTPGRVAWDAWGGNPGRDWVQQEQFKKL